MANPEREFMGSLLRTNAELVADVLCGSGSGFGSGSGSQPGSGLGSGPGSDADPEAVMRAIAATRSLSVIVEDTLRSLVHQARGEGRTWAEIGEVLHVTRQAAFQRFGGPAAPVGGAEDRELQPLVNATELALPVIRHFLEGDWEATRANFDERMLDACTPALLASVLEKVRDGGGGLLEIGTPSVSVRSGYSVVDVPLAFARGDATSQVALNPDGQVSGFFIRNAGG